MKQVFVILIELLSVLIPKLKKEAPAVGIAETKEVLIAANEITLFILQQLKDGLSADDAVAVYTKLLTDQEFKIKIMIAYENFAAIPAEVVDIDISEGMELSKIQLEYAQKFLNLYV